MKSPAFIKQDIILAGLSCTKMTQLSKGNQVRKFRDAFDAGRNAAMEHSAAAGGAPYDPAGQQNKRGRLRSIGKWRFILVRGVVRIGGPMFVLGLGWIVISHLSEDLHSAQLLSGSRFQYLLGHWVIAVSVSAGVSVFFGLVIGFLAWQRVTSDVWPGAKPDPESSTTTLGPLSLR
jgi:hypothetical protein